VHAPIRSEDLVLGHVNKPEHVGHHIQLKIGNEVIAVVVLEIRSCVVAQVVDKISSRRRQRPPS